MYRNKVREQIKKAKKLLLEGGWNLPKIIAKGHKKRWGSCSSKCNL